MAEAEGKTEEKATAKGNAGGKLVPIVLVVNSVLLASLLVLQVLKPGGAKHDAKDAKPEERAAAEAPEKGKPAKPVAPGPTLRLPDFVVHLRDTDTERYARISFEVEVQDEKAKEAVTARMPVIRDTFLAYLSDRSAGDLRGSEALVRIKTALSEKLAEVAPGAPVRALYVTDLVVQ